MDFVIHFHGLGDLMRNCPSFYLAMIFRVFGLQRREKEKKREEKILFVKIEDD